MQHGGEGKRKNATRQLPPDPNSHSIRRSIQHLPCPFMGTSAAWQVECECLMLERDPLSPGFTALSAGFILTVVARWLCKAATADTIIEGRF